MTSQCCTKNLGGEQNLAKISYILTYKIVLTNLKPHIHDKPLYGMALAAVFSEVKLVCVRIPRVSSEQGTNLYVGKYGFSLVHPNVQPPLHSQSHAPIEMAMRTRVICAVIG